ncbi:MAG: hypothetical protein RL338_1766 [Chloroflexota bacterium]|jgi:DNA-binding transcriptional MerR regulator
MDILTVVMATVKIPAMNDHTLSELAALTGIPARTIRYYIGQGLLPPAATAGRGARYPAVALARLRLIARMRDEHLPLAEIRRRLGQLGDAEVELLAAEPAVEPPAGSALDYVRAVLGQAPAAGRTAERPAAYAAVPGAAPPAPGPGEPGEGLVEVAPNFLRMASGAFLGVAAAPMPKGRQAERSHWERIVLGEGIELHVRRPLSRRENRLVERLIAFADQLKGEQS